MKCCIQVLSIRKESECYQIPDETIKKNLAHRTISKFVKKIKRSVSEAGAEGSVIASGGLENDVSVVVEGSKGYKT